MARTFFNSDLREHLGQYRTAAQFRQAVGGIFVDDAQLMRVLGELSGREFGAVIRSSTNKSMTPVLKDARRNIKAEGAVDSGLLQRSLGKKNKAYKRAAAQVVLVGPRRGFRQKVLRRQTTIPLPARSRARIANPVNYAHLVEYGHKGRGRVIRGRGRKAVLPGVTRPKPFIVPAFKKNKSLVERNLKTQLGADILRRWSKANSKGA